MEQKQGIDKWILIVSVILLCIGFIAVTSASIMESTIKYGDAWYQAKKHGMSIGMSLVCGLICLSIRSSFWKNRSIIALFVVSLMLVAVLAIGREINGAKRWLSLGIMNMQPAEFLKLLWILYFGGYVSKRILSISTTYLGFFKPFAFLFVILCLLMSQPDFGSFVVISVITMAIIWVAGAGFLKFLSVFIPLGFAGIFAIAMSAYRMRRISTFRDPWADPFGSGYQLIQSLMAFGRGGLKGEGLGNSMLKQGYLPEAHTDFITSIIGEEFGFIGMCVLILLELFIIYKALAIGIRILKVDAIFQGYVCVGIGAWFLLQTLINITAASGGMPTKGLTLPLISYGGSSLMVTCSAIAILLRIDYEWRNNIIKDRRDE